MSQVTGKQSFLTISDITDLLWVDKSTVYRWVREGTFPRPTIKHGRCVRWERTVFDAWVNAQRNRNG
jgi:prophage regulatory protein